MTQTAEQRRLTRIASSMNTRARQFGSDGILTAQDLAVAVVTWDYTCAYCGVLLTSGQHGFDHMIPLALRGPNRGNNVVPVCQSCNRRKFTKTPAELKEYENLRVNCSVCKKEYRPRWAEWKNGRARTCSLSCAAKLARH